MDYNISKDIPLPSFNNRSDENPKKFLEDFEEFIELKGVPKEWKSFWFKKCLGETTKLWFDAIGKDTKKFEELKRRFLDRYWSADRQAEIIRKFYTPGAYSNKEQTRERYLLASCRENSYLDNPLTDRSLIRVISRQLGSEIAKHTIGSNISTIEEFAKMLNVWEEVDKEEGARKYTRPEMNNNNNHWDHNKNWRNNIGRRTEYDRERSNGDCHDKENRGKEQQWKPLRETNREPSKERMENHQNSAWRSRGLARGEEENLN